MRTCPSEANEVVGLSLLFRIRPSLSLCELKPLLTSFLLVQSDGVCQDGRSSSMQGMKEGVLCDLGTDCHDCGLFYWRVPVSHGDSPLPRPIRQLQARETPVFLRRTMTVPRFWMPYANPKFDVDVSGQVHHDGLVEAGNTQIVHHNLAVSIHEEPIAFLPLSCACFLE